MSSIAFATSLQSTGYYGDSNYDEFMNTMSEYMPHVLNNFTEMLAKYVSCKLGSELNEEDYAFYDSVLNLTKNAKHYGIIRFVIENYGMVTINNYPRESDHSQHTTTVVSNEKYYVVSFLEKYVKDTDAIITWLLCINDLKCETMKNTLVLSIMNECTVENNVCIMRECIKIFHDNQAVLCINDINNPYYQYFLEFGSSWNIFDLL